MISDFTQFDPTADEQAETDRAVQNFVDAQKAVPELERVNLSGPKFDGPIGQPASDSVKSVPTSEELAETDRAVQEFMQAQDAVPESKKVNLNSEKFDGPIGE